MTLALETSRTRRQVQAEERREQILDAALDIFAEKGVRATTTRDIAQAVGVAEGLIFHYFGSKSGLVRAVFERNALAPEFDELLLRLRDEPLETALLAMTRGYVEIMQKHHKFVRMTVSEAIRDDEVAAILDQFMSAGMQRSQDFLEERVARGEMEPHDVTITLRMLQGSTIWYTLMHGRLWRDFPAPSPKDFNESCTHLILSGIKKQ